MLDDAPHNPAGRPALKRMASGIAGLDDILHGGFIVNGLYLVQGSPGAGKTIFGNQLCYTHIAAGGRALYVTLLSEQHERMLANIGQFSFYDAEHVARSMVYASAFQLLERDGLAGLLGLLRREIVAHDASLLVLDGMVAADAYASTELELKKFVHELQVLAAAADCTMLLLTSAKIAEVSAEHTMVDGLIELSDTAHGWRAERDLCVRKLRGSDYLRGRHAMGITGEGIVVWPRFESLLTDKVPRANNALAPRLTTQITGMDDMLGGGLPASSSTLVLGPSGAGKTAMGLHFLAGSTEQMPGLLLGFYETPDQLLSRASGMAPGLPDLVARGVVEILWQSPAEDLMDRVATDLMTHVRRRGVRRLVIDGLLGFQDMTVQPERIPNFYRALTTALRALGVTTICTVEVADLIGPMMRQPITRLTPVAENLILLRYVEDDARLKRLLSIMKVRDSFFDVRLREFNIGPGGIVLGEGFAGSRALLSGFPEAETGSADAPEPARDPSGTA